LDGITNLQKLDLVIWARFGEDEDFDAEHWGTQDRERVRHEDLMKSLASNTTRRMEAQSFATPRQKA
jgi:hypothetical protein